MAKVALVDDHGVVRAGVRRLLEEQFEIVCEAGDARTARASVDQFAPDVVIVNFGMTATDGGAVTRDLRRRSSARVLALGLRSSEREAREAFSAGASGYVASREPPENLLSAVDVVAGGGRYVSPCLPPDVLAQDDGAPDPLSPLSPREREVFMLLTRGHTNASVALELCISPKTVETHRGRITQKLGCRGVSALLSFAARNHLLQY